MTDREMVVAAAEKVLGWRASKAPSGINYGEPGGRWRFTIWPNGATEGWNPLDSIADAWMLVEKAREWDGEQADQWPAFVEAMREQHGDGVGYLLYEMTPRSIVLACLRAVGVPA